MTETSNYLMLMAELCSHPSWEVHTWIEICASLNHRKKAKADGSQLIPRKHTETLVLLGCGYNSRTAHQNRQSGISCEISRAHELFRRSQT